MRTNASRQPGTVGDTPARLDLIQPSRSERFAAWLFVLPYFIGSFTNLSGTEHGIRSPDVEIIGFIVMLLAGASGVIQIRRSDVGLAINRALLVIGTLSVLLLLYLFRGYPSTFGTEHSYIRHGIVFVLAYGAVAIFAALFYRPQLFEEVVWRCCRLFSWIAVTAYCLSLLTHRQFLVSIRNGSPRLEGLLSEPSGWGPVVVVLAILAWRRRSWRNVLLAFVVGALAKSAICFVVAGIAIPLIVLLTGQWRHKLPVLIVVAILVPLGLSFVETADAAKYENSSNQVEVAVGRLISGVQNIKSDGSIGSNDRFNSTTVTIDEVRQNNWMHTGAGPEASQVYFPAKFPTSQYAVSVEPNALWVEILFDFGEGGVVVLMALTGAALWTTRRSPGLIAVIIPFCVASAVNSAEGTELHQFLALGIFLGAFGWQHEAERVTAQVANNAVQRTKPWRHVPRRGQSIP